MRPCARPSSFYHTANAKQLGGGHGTRLVNMHIWVVVHVYIYHVAMETASSTCIMYIYLIEFNMVYNHSQLVHISDTFPARVWRYPSACSPQGSKPPPQQGGCITDRHPQTVVFILQCTAQFFPSPVLTPDPPPPYKDGRSRVSFSPSPRSPSSFSIQKRVWERD